MNVRIVYLMRGLPACGKSYSARKLAGASGVICETDDYFYTQVGDDPKRYDYREELLEQARRWNFQRFTQAVRTGVSPIVVDRGNGRNRESQEYALHAVDNGYHVELKEPESQWWQELRVLLKYKQYVDGRLFDAWAKKLADATRDTHRVPSSTIRPWMSHWRHDLTIDDVVNYTEPSEHLRDRTGSFLNGIKMEAGTTVLDDGEKDKFSGNSGRD